MAQSCALQMHRLSEIFASRSSSSSARSRRRACKQLCSPSACNQETSIAAPSVPKAHHPASSSSWNAALATIKQSNAFDRDFTAIALVNWWDAGRLTGLREAVQ